MTDLPSLYEAAARAAWQLPSTQAMFRDDQETSYVALMTDRPDFRALVDAVRRHVLDQAAADLQAAADAWSADNPDSPVARGIGFAAARIRHRAENRPPTGPGATQPAQDASVVTQEGPGPCGGAATAPRDTARTWLAELLDAAMDRWLANPGWPVGYLADAILDAPGVEVEHGTYRDTGDPAEIRHDVVIRLPARPIGEAT